MRHSVTLVAAALFLSVAPRLLAAEATAPASAAGISVARGPSMHIEVPYFTHQEAAVAVDGRLDEAIWAKLPSYDGMKVISPDTMAEPAYPTLMRYFYTDQGLYVGAKLVQPPETLVARLSGRDQFINRDGFGITLDTSGDGHYGYWFAVNLGGSVMDGKVAPERRYTNQWDGPWRHGTAELDDGWSLEMFLPWSMMAMPKSEGARRMGFWTNRKVAHLDERWSSPPRPFTVARFMSDLGEMRFGEVQPQRQLDLFPHVSATYDGIKADAEYRVGLDLFWRPSSNLQVTATANPDFGARGKRRCGGQPHRLRDLLSRKAAVLSGGPRSLRNHPQIPGGAAWRAPAAAAPGAAHQPSIQRPPPWSTPDASAGRRASTCPTT